MEGESLDESHLEIATNIGESNPNDEDGEQSVPKKSKQTRELIVCVFCAKEYQGIGGLKCQLHYCPLIPNNVEKSNFV